MTMPAKNRLVGNDIIDLRSEGTRDKASEQRFLERVFTAEERFFLRQLDDPDIGLWLLWGAKEAAYKIICKLVTPRPVFSHRRYVVTPELSTVPQLMQGGFRAQVTWQDVEIAVSFDLNEERIHVLALWWQGQEPEPSEIVFSCRKLQPEELAEPSGPGEPSQLSRGVRRHAIPAFAEFLSVPESALRIHRPQEPDPRQPPTLLLNDRPAPADISLSHHGQWVAWAACRYSEPPF